MAITGIDAPGRAQIEAKTLRTDRWWIQPALVVLGLTAFVAYGVWRVFWGTDTYYAAPVPLDLLLARASPPTACRARTTSARSSAAGGRCPRRCSSPGLPARLPADLLLLPQGLLPVVLALAARRAPSPSRTRSTRARRRFPLILQNAHRWFFYLGLVLQRDPHLRRGPRLPQPAGRVGPHGPRHPGAAGQRRPAVVVLALVPLVPAHRRRPADPLLQAPAPLPDVDRRVETQRPPRRASPGSRCSASPWPTSTSVPSHPARSPTSTFF